MPEIAGELAKIERKRGRIIRFHFTAILFQVTFNKAPFEVV